MIKKGIILAGGIGTRMSPLTKAVNKQLLPLYDKPLIYYPLSVLMLAGIKKYLIIVNKGQLGQFRKILPEKNNLGISIEYKEQLKPGGLPQAFTIGEKFIGSDNVSLILGDNFFYGQSLIKNLKKNMNFKKGARIFLHPVINSSLYGVATINNKKQVITPLIAFKRTSIEKDQNLAVDKLNPLDPKLHYTFQKQYTDRNRYDKFAVQQGLNEQRELYSVAVPDYITLQYEFIVWTTYIEQMNKIVGIWKTILDKNNTWII